MQLDHLARRRGRGGDLRRVGLDEQRHPDAGAPSASATQGRDAVVLAGDVEAALGGHLLAPLRHQAGGVRPVRSAMASISSVTAISKFSGLPRRRVSRPAFDVGVGDVTAILAQVGGDAVGAGRDGNLRRAGGIGIAPPRALRMVATWSMLTPSRSTVTRTSSAEMSAGAAWTVERNALRARQPRRETRQAPDSRLGSSSSCRLLAGRRPPRQDGRRL